MSFKDIADVIRKHTGEDSDSVVKPEKSKAARAFELFLQGKQSVEVAIELDMSADEVEELHVQYWRLSRLDDLEDLYHEAKYSLTLLVQLLFLAHPGFATSTLSTPYNKTSFENLEIIKVISFNNTSLSSIAVDPVSDLVYVSQTRLLFQLFAYFMLGAECYWFCDCLEFHVSVFCYLYS
jgi:hypothetical protein